MNRAGRVYGAVAIGAAAVWLCGAAPPLPVQAQRAGGAASLFLQTKERWAIKTGADPGARAISLKTARTATVAELIRRPRPAGLPDNASTREARTTRYGDSEHRLFTIDADIVRFKFEDDDRDYHVVIRDHGDIHAEDAPVESGARRTMIVEFPDPAVVSARSPWRKAIHSARAEFESRVSPQPRFTYRVIHARITGVGFFDFLHGQSGVAPNGIELHPVLKIDFLESDLPSGGAALHRSPAAGSSGGPGRANGKVWVNLNSGVYWRQGSERFGTTKRGVYMTERQAERAGYRAAKGQ